MITKLVSCFYVFRRVVFIWFFSVYLNVLNFFQFAVWEFFKVDWWLQNCCKILRIWKFRLQLQIHKQNTQFLDPLNEGPTKYPQSVYSFLWKRFQKFSDYLYEVSMSSDKGRYLEVFGPKEPKLGPKLGISSFMKTSCASVFSILQEVITIQSLKFGLNNLCKKILLWRF